MTNLLIYVLDGLRADHVGAYGYHRPTTPNLDRLAADPRGLRFANAFSPSTRATPAVASLLTGCYPPTHGVRGQESQLAPGVAQLPALLQAAGFHTMGICASAAAAHLGCGLGFDRMVDLSGQVRLEAPTSAWAEAIEATAGAWLDELAQARSRPPVGAAGGSSASPSERRWLLWLWDYGLHTPYRPPGEFDRWGDPRNRAPSDGSFEGLGRSANRAALQRLIDLYDGAIAFADAQLGRLLDRLVTLSLYDDTLIVVVGSHGVAFGEHGDFGHGLLAYEEVVRVPMVIKFPAAGAGRSGVCDSMIELVDIAPTVLDSLGLRPLALGMQGYNLNPVLLGKQPGRAVVYAETCTFDTGHRLLAVRNEGWKYLRSDPPAPAGTREEAVAEQGGWRRRLASTWRQIAGGDAVKQVLRDPAAALRRRMIPREMLFDLQADPMELRNVVDQYQDVAHGMSSMLEAWLAECRVYADLNGQRMMLPGYASTDAAQPQGLGLSMTGDDSQHTA